MAKIAITLPSTQLVELTSQRTVTESRVVYRKRDGTLAETEWREGGGEAIVFGTIIGFERRDVSRNVANGSGGFLAVYKSEDGTPFTGDKAYATDDEATSANSKAIGAVNVQEYLEVAKKGAIEALDHYLRGLVTLG